LAGKYRLSKSAIHRHIGIRFYGEPAYYAPQRAKRIRGYRDQLLTFNDDIQGTAAVVCGALTAAVKVFGAKLKTSRLFSTEQALRPLAWRITCAWHLWASL
jgi:hypothetical protein